MREPCAGSTWEPRIGHRRCGNSGKVQRGGKWYCGTHDPEAKRAREERRAEQHARQRAVDTARYAVQDAEREAVAALLGESGPLSARLSAARETISAARKALGEAKNALAEFRRSTASPRSGC
jgi:uncharacterized Zn finger protein (UPF0148 family)